MDRRLREDGHFAWSKDFSDSASTVLVDHEGACLTGNGDDEVGGSGVDVWWQHAAGPKVEHGHRHALANGGGEGGGVGIHDASWGEGVLVGLGEVEQPVVVVGEELHTVQVGVGHPKLGDEVWVGILVNGIDCGNDGQDEEGEKSEDHGEDFPVESATRLLLAGLLGSKI